MASAPRSGGERRAGSTLNVASLGPADHHTRASGARGVWHGAPGEVEASRRVSDR